MTKHTQGTNLFECDECHTQQASSQGLPPGWFQWEFRAFARLQATEILPRPFKTNRLQFIRQFPNRTIFAHLCSVKCAVSWIRGDLMGFEAYEESLRHIFKALTDQETKEAKTASPLVLDIQGESDGKDE